MDLDGVLVDSFREGLRRIQIVCALHDVRFERDTRAKLFNNWGLPGVELLVRCLGVNETLAHRMYTGRSSIKWPRPRLFPALAKCSTGSGGTVLKQPSSPRVIARIFSKCSTSA